jgi:hypothetical protein
VRYQVQQITADTMGTYKALYDQGGTPWDDARTDLVREELDVKGNPIDGTREIIAENVVDLKFGVTVAQSFTGTSVNQLATFVPETAQDLVYQWAGNVSNAGALPERIEALRVRMSIRSREPDRETDITSGGSVAPGLYRFKLTKDGKTQYARVRTLQADVALNNQMGVSW